MKRAILLLTALALLLCAGCACAANLEKEYENAVELLQKGEYAQAAEAFYALNDYEEAPLLAMYSAAHSAAQSGNYYDAVTAFTMLGSFRDSSLLVTYYTALFHEWIQDYEEAGEILADLKLYRDCNARLASYPEKINARDYARADAHEQAGRLEKALSGFEDLIPYSDSALRATGVQEKINARDYAAAEALMAEGKYAEASAAFAALGDYSDAADRVYEPYYVQAEALLAEGKYAEASAAFATDGTYSDAASRAQAAYYAYAEALMEDGKYAEASVAFTTLGDYSDAADRVNEPYYVQAEALLAENKYAEAIIAFTNAGTYRDAAVRKQQTQAAYYAAAEALLADGKYAEASVAFTTLGDYSDASTRAQAAYYAYAEALMAEGKYAHAIVAFKNAGDYNDATTRILQTQKLFFDTAAVYEVEGFRKMAIVIAVDKAGKIASFEVVKHNETPNFGADVINAGFDALIGQNIATAKVDIVAGATMTCDALNDAIALAATATPAVFLYEVEGFRKIKVAIAVDETGKIAFFDVVDHNETPNFGADVINAGFDALIGQDVANAKVDVKAGATMTCHALNDAIALAAAVTPATAFVYEVEGFKKMKVAIAVDKAGKITSFDVVEHNETPNFGADVINAGFDALIGQDIATAKVDVKAGATMTCDALNAALAQAAAATPKTLPELSEETPATDPADATVVKATIYAVQAKGMSKHPFMLNIAVDDQGQIVSAVCTEQSEGEGAKLLTDDALAVLVNQHISNASVDIDADFIATSNAINNALTLVAAAVPVYNVSGWNLFK